MAPIRTHTHHQGPFRFFMFRLYLKETKKVCMYLCVCVRKCNCYTLFRIFYLTVLLVVHL